MACGACDVEIVVRGTGDSGGEEADSEQRIEDSEERQQ
jgi:hypothetical protein